MCDELGKAISDIFNKEKVLINDYEKIITDARETVLGCIMHTCGVGIPRLMETLLSLDTPRLTKLFVLGFLSEVKIKENASSIANILKETMFLEDKDVVLLAAYTLSVCFRKEALDFLNQKPNCCHYETAKKVIEHYSK